MATVVAKYPVLAPAHPARGRPVSPTLNGSWRAPSPSSSSAWSSLRSSPNLASTALPVDAAAPGSPPLPAVFASLHPLAAAPPRSARLRAPRGSVRVMPDPRLINRLTAAGFSYKAAVSALRLANNDLADATEQLRRDAQDARPWPISASESATASA